MEVVWHVMSYLVPPEPYIPISEPSQTLESGIRVIVVSSAYLLRDMMQMAQDWNHCYGSTKVEKFTFCRCGEWISSMKNEVPLCMTFSDAPSLEWLRPFSLWRLAMEDELILQHRGERRCLRVMRRQWNWDQMRGSYLRLIQDLMQPSWTSEWEKRSSRSTIMSHLNLFFRTLKLVQESISQEKWSCSSNHLWTATCANGQLCLLNRMYVNYVRLLTDWMVYEYGRHQGPAGRGSLSIQESLDLYLHVSSRLPSVLSRLTSKSADDYQLLMEQ